VSTYQVEMESMAENLSLVSRVAFDQLLPTELLTAIFDCLETSAEVNDIRLTCQDFYQAAWSPFTRSCNGRIFHLTACSLRALQRLSRTEQVIPYVSTLNIGTVCCSSKGDFSLYPGAKRACSREDRIRRRAACWQYREMSREDAALERSGELREMLTAALTKWSSLERINVVEGGRL